MHNDLKILPHCASRSLRLHWTSTETKDRTGRRLTLRDHECNLMPPVKVTVQSGIYRIATGSAELVSVTVKGIGGELVVNSYLPIHQVGRSPQGVIRSLRPIHGQVDLPRGKIDCADHRIGYRVDDHIEAVGRA